MQSAKDHWIGLVDIYKDIEETRPGGHDIMDITSLGDDSCIALIRARDREIVDETVKATIAFMNDPNNKIAEAIKLCDSVLRDLG